MLNGFKNFMKYSFASKSLTPINNINNTNAPPGRENSPLVRYNNVLWLFGMCGPSSTQDQDLWFYNLTATTVDWVQINTSVLPSSARPIGRCGHTFNRITNTNYGLIFGGHYTLLNGYLNDLWQFDFENQTFTQLTTTGVIPLPRAYHIAAYYDGLLLVYSGDGDSFLHFSDLWAYSISKNFWINIIPLGDNPAIPLPRIQAAGLVYQNNLIIYAGKTYGPDPLTNAEVTLPLNDFWVFKLGCPNDCSGNGNCSELVCNCSTCYSGQDCSVKICATYNPTNVGLLVGIIVGSILGACLMVGVSAFVGKKANKYKKARMRQKALLSGQQDTPQPESPATTNTTVLNKTDSIIT